MRIVMGVVWFLVIEFMFGLIGYFLLTRLMGVNSNGNPPVWFIIFVIVASFVIAVWGTVTEKLPGTKKK